MVITGVRFDSNICVHEIGLRRLPKGELPAIQKNVDAIAAACYDVERIPAPWWVKVDNRDYIENLATKTLGLLEGFDGAYRAQCQSAVLRRACIMR